MRRMITTKQQEFVEDLGKQIEIDTESDAVNISGIGDLYLSSTSEDPHAQIAVTENPNIYFGLYNEEEEKSTIALELYSTGYSNAMRFNGIDFFADTIKSVTFVDDSEEPSFEIPVDINYLSMTKDIKADVGGGDTYPSGIVFHGQVSNFAQKDAFNTAAPQTLLIKSMTVGENEDVYGFVGTKLIIGGNKENVYLWDSVEECYVLQGTFQPIGSGRLEVALISSGNNVFCYNQ